MKDIPEESFLPNEKISRRKFSSVVLKSVSFGFGITVLSTSNVANAAGEPDCTAENPNLCSWFIGNSCGMIGHTNSCSGDSSNKCTGGDSNVCYVNNTCNESGSNRCNSGSSNSCKEQNQCNGTNANTCFTSTNNLCQPTTANSCTPISANTNDEGL